MIRRPTRRETPPADLVALVGRDDRVLSWGDAAGRASADAGVRDSSAGSPAVIGASIRGLWWPVDPGPTAAGEAPPWRLIGWPLIDKVTWRDNVLTVVEAELVEDFLLLDRPAVTAALVRPRDLPPVVRKRVEANIARSELRSVPGGAARFVARRIPGRDGLVWWVRLEAGTSDSADLRALLADEVARLNAEQSAIEP